MQRRNRFRDFRKAWTQAPQSARQQPASPIPNVGFSPSVSNAAITACRNALDEQTDGNIDFVGSEYPEANLVVYMTVVSNSAPWKCFTANDGDTRRWSSWAAKGRSRRSA